MTHTPTATSTLPIEIELRTERNGPALWREPVRPRDVVDGFIETWWRSGPRRGRPELTLDDLSLSLLPVPEKPGSQWCAGYALVAEGAGLETARFAFSREGLEHVARRAVRALIEQGRITAEDLTFWWLRCRGAAVPSPIPAEDVPATPIVELCEHPLAPLLERAEERGPATDPALHHVFFTAAARATAERMARQGGEERPPVETGCVLVGPLVLCPESREVYSVVLDALEATEASRREFSLDYTGATWQRIQAVLRARRAQPETRAHRLLGQAHGHNFLPDGGAAPCAECERLAVCDRTSAWLSPDDREFCRAVFCGEPWQLSQVFGLDARGRGVEAFYGQNRGRLALRGYRVIPEFPLP